eukprot:4056081-Amphidinium_carterae.1
MESSCSDSLGGVGPNDMCEKGAHPKNAARDLGKRWLVADVDWPDKYLVEIPIQGEDNEVELVNITFALPHQFDNLLSRPQRLEPYIEAWRKETLTANAIPSNEVEDYTPLALWGDGVPFQKEQSLFMRIPILVVEVLLSMANGGCSERMLVCALPTLKLTERSLEEVWKVLHWSFAHLWLGMHPCMRHDNTAWKLDESKGRALAGRPLKRAFLAQLRGDYDFFAREVRLQHWSSLQPCWLCQVQKANLENLDAFRTLAWSSDEYFKWKLDQGQEVAAICGSPAFSTYSIAIDWLHTVDLGVSQDYQGNVLWAAVRYKGFFDGNTRMERLKQLTLAMKAYYTTSLVSNRYKILKEPMIKREHEAPKLRGKASEARGLLPFTLRIAKQMWQRDPSDMNLLMVKAGDALLCTSQGSMGSSVPCYSLGLVLKANDADPFNLMVFQGFAREFLHQYHALHQASESFVWKPKFHLFQELIEK